MSKLWKEIKYDADFIKGHTLQPKWYKILKVFVLLGVIIGFLVLFGTFKTLVFFGIFFSLSFLVHMLYRINTNKFTQSWLDFIVIEENDQLKYDRVGIYYYFFILFNLLLSLLITFIVL
ncbi:MAG: hypothetical protein WBB69_12475 [Anaerolineales bacterium]